MHYFIPQRNFQVETSDGFKSTPSEETANRIYNSHVENNTPVEFYREGIKLKEFKPPK